MKQHQKAGIAGGLIIIGYFVYNIYHAIRISKNYPFTESLLPELLNAITTIAIPIVPAIILILSKDFNKKYLWAVWFYPAIVGLGILNVLLANDPLAAGIPMLIFVLPFCIIFTILLILLKKDVLR